MKAKREAKVEFKSALKNGQKGKLRYVCFITVLRIQSSKHVLLQIVPTRVAAAPEGCPPLACSAEGEPPDALQGLVHLVLGAEAPGFPSAFVRS